MSHVHVLSALKVWLTVWPDLALNTMSYTCRWTSPSMSLVTLIVTVSFWCADRLLGDIALAPVTVTLNVRFWAPWLRPALIRIPPATMNTSRTPMATAIRLRLILPPLIRVRARARERSVRADEPRG